MNIIWALCDYRIFLEEILIAETKWASIHAQGESKNSDGGTRIGDTIEAEGKREELT